MRVANSATAIAPPTNSTIMAAVSWMVPRRAAGGDVPIAHVHDLARAVIEAPAFRVTRKILHGGSPEFAVPKALELASMVLSNDDGAAEYFAAQT